MDGDIYYYIKEPNGPANLHCEDEEESTLKNVPYYPQSFYSTTQEKGVIQKDYKATIFYSEGKPSYIVPAHSPGQARFIDLFQGGRLEVGERFLIYEKPDADTLVIEDLENEMQAKTVAIAQKDYRSYGPAKLGEKHIWTLTFDKKNYTEGQRCLFIWPARDTIIDLEVAHPSIGPVYQVEGLSDNSAVIVSLRNERELVRVYDVEENYLSRPFYQNSAVTRYLRDGKKVFFQDNTVINLEESKEEFWKAYSRVME